MKPVRMKGRHGSRPDGNEGGLTDAVPVTRKDQVSGGVGVGGDDCDIREKSAVVRVQAKRTGFGEDTVKLSADVGEKSLQPVVAVGSRPPGAALFSREI